jgi:PAS domain S-box-containing protein
VLALGAWLLPDTPGGQDIRAVAALEAASALLAAFVGFLALLRYAGRPDRSLLPIGTGFLASAALEFLILLLHRGGEGPLPLAGPGALLPSAGVGWLWSSSIVALFMVLSSPIARSVPARLTASVRRLSLGAGGLVVAGLLAAWLGPNPGSLGPVPRPWEVVPTVLFTVALVGYVKAARWRLESLEHWLVMALLIGAMAHGGFGAWAGVTGGSRDLGALLLVAASRLAMLVGLFLAVLELFRHEEESGELHRQVNASLAREIAVRKETESILQESEERLQDFIDSADDLIQITDPSGALEYVNPAWRRYLGYEADEIAGLDFFQVVHAESREAARKGYRDALTGAPVVGLEIRLVGKDGREVIARASMNSRLVDGEPRSVRSILRDVTEEKRARDELIRSEANLSAIVESTGDAIWAVDSDLRLVSFNAAFALMAEAVTGREPVLGGDATRGLPPEEEMRFREAFGRALNGERLSELWHFDLEGQRRAFELYFNPILEGFRVTGAVVFLKDVTRRVRAEEAMLAAKEEAEQANRSKSQFLANMSHELRTPLNSVIGFTNILLKRKGEAMDEKNRGFLERILANGKHLLSLINEILDLAKIEAGRMELAQEAVRLQAFLPEVVAQLEGQVRERPVELRTEIPDELDPLWTDPGKLKQVLINLIGNALKFTETGTVTVRVDALSTHPEIATRISVQDTGPGIPKERLDAVFEAFQQADGTTARRFGGTGLGLSISRSLCNLMGYDLTVRSRVGEGSTFSVELNPRPGALEGAEAPAQATEDLMEDVSEVREAKPDDLSGLALENPPWVLVVDSEPDSRLLLSHLLEDLGCRVATASGGLEGIDLAGRMKPDVITLDLYMPGMGGWSVLQALKDHPDLQHVPVVVVAEVAGDANPRVFGAAGVVSKPVEREAIVTTLRRVLGPGE